MATILIVDDEPDIRYLIRLIFEGAGHRVMEASNGAIGLKYVKETRPDLVTTDVMMPVMGGLKLIEWMRSDPTIAKIPILAISGNAELATAADRVLSKPFDPAALLSAATLLLKDGGR